LKRKALLIANYSVKAEAFARYWPEDKWDLHLYTYQKNEWFPGMSERFGDKWIARLPEKNKYQFAGDRSTKKKKKSKTSNTFWTQKRKVRRFLQHRLLRFHRQKVFDWAVPTILELESIKNWINPDLVISIYEPLSANLIARKISNFYGIPWIAYFRDHCTTYRELIRVPGLWHFHSICDRWIHSSANGLVGVSQQFVDILGSYYNIPQKKAHVITGGFNDSYLPPDIRDRCTKRRFKQKLPSDNIPRQSSPLRVCYIGKLHRHQVESLLLIFDSLLVVSNNNVPVELRLVLSNASYVFPKKVRLAIEELKRAGVTLNFSPIRIDYQKALETLEASDVNIILEGINPPHNTTGTLTGKIFDLMMIAQPVIAICASSLPIGDYLHETGIGINCENTEGVVRALMEVWRSRQEENMPNWYSPDGYAIEQYSYSSMAKKMHNLCEDIHNKTLGNLE
jgi:hypothetical protein